MSARWCRVCAAPSTAPVWWWVRCGPWPLHTTAVAWGLLGCAVGEDSCPRCPHPCLDDTPGCNRPVCTTRHASWHGLFHPITRS